MVSIEPETISDEAKIIPALKKKLPKCPLRFFHSTTKPLGCICNCSHVYLILTLGDWDSWARDPIPHLLSAYRGGVWLPPRPRICQVHIQVQKNWGDDNTNLEVGRGRRAGREQRDGALKVRQVRVFVLWVITIRV